MWTRRSARLSCGCVSSLSDIKEWRERPAGSSWRQTSKASESSLTCFHENLTSNTWCGLAIAPISAILLSCACTVPKKTGLPFPIRGSTSAKRSNFVDSHEVCCPIKKKKGRAATYQIGLIVVNVNFNIEGEREPAREKVKFSWNRYCQNKLRRLVRWMFFAPNTWLTIPKTSKFEKP